MLLKVSVLVNNIFEKVSRSYAKDFFAGVDPTGEYTFQYGMDDSRANASPGNQASRRLVGTIGGALGGALVVPAAIGGIVGGIRGGIFGGGGGVKKVLNTVRKEMVQGAIDPYRRIYRGLNVNSAVRTKQRGEKLSPQQAEQLSRLLNEQTNNYSMLQFPQVKKYLNKGNKPAHMDKLLSSMSPIQLGTLRYDTLRDLTTGSSLIGLSGLVSGVSAYRQYGKGVRTGEEMRGYSRN